MDHKIRNKWFNNSSRIVLFILLFSFASKASDVGNIIAGYTRKWGKLKYLSKNERKWDSIYVDNIRNIFKYNTELAGQINDKYKSNKKENRFRGNKGLYNKEMPWLYSKNLKLFNPNGFFVNKDLALLGIAKAWNIINYFYFYKNDLRGNWDSLLTVYIDDIVNLQSLDSKIISITYRLTINKMEADLNDCHATLYNDNYLNFHYWGEYKPPIEVKITDKKTVILSYIDSTLRNVGLKVGDTLNSINDIAIDKLIDSVRIYCGCKYNSGINRELSISILRAPKNTFSKFEFNHKIFSLKHTFYYRWALKYGDNSRSINDSILYVNLSRIKNENDFKNEYNINPKPKYLILDFRYGTYGVEYLVYNFVKKNNDFIVFHYPDFSSLGSFKSKTRRISTFFPGQKFSKKLNYTSLFLLVDAHTQSHSEFIIMALQTMQNVYTIGDTSAGAIAMIRKVYLPGNILFVFTAVGANYPRSNEVREFVKLNKVINPSQIMDVEKIILEVFKNRKEEENVETDN